MTEFEKLAVEGEPWIGDPETEGQLNAAFRDKLRVCWERSGRPLEAFLSDAARYVAREFVEDRVSFSQAYGVADALWQGSLFFGGASGHVIPEPVMSLYLALDGCIVPGGPPVEEFTEREAKPMLAEMLARP